MQHASEMFSIPKTVLWRRIQKEGYQILRSEMRRSYDSDKREAAVKALERGENLTKVALEFKVIFVVLRSHDSRNFERSESSGSDCIFRFQRLLYLGIRLGW